MDGPATIEVLRQARDLISDPSRWHQGSLATNRLGHTCEPDDSSAVRWCAAGAILRVDPASHGLAARYLSRYCISSRVQMLAGLNDNGTHKEVLRLFDDCIRELEAS